MSRHASVNEISALMAAIELLQEASEGKSVNFLNLTLMLTSNVIYRVANEGRASVVATEFCTKLHSSLVLLEQAITENRIDEILTVEEDFGDE